MIELPFWPRLTLAALATWRVCHLLALEDGPGDILARLRARLGDGVLGRLMDCFYCVSVWVAAPFALLVAATPLELVLVWPALSGAACLLERLGPPAPLMIEAPRDATRGGVNGPAPPGQRGREGPLSIESAQKGTGDEHGMLRPETRSATSTADDASDSRAVGENVDPVDRDQRVDSASR